MKRLTLVAPPFRPVLPEGGDFRRCALAFALLVGVAFAQDPLAKPKVSAVNRVTVMAPKLVYLKPGGAATTTQISFQVKPGYHINSNQPGSELLLPTVLKLSPPTNIGVGSLEYPPGRQQSFPFSPDEKLSVYTGDFTIGLRVGAAKNMPPGRFRVHGFLNYQACDDRACYPPAKLPVAFDVQVGRSTSTRTRRNPPQSPHIHN